jgi:hypothetical protein
VPLPLVEAQCHETSAKKHALRLWPRSDGKHRVVKHLLEDLDERGLSTQRRYLA